MKNQVRYRTKLTAQEIKDMIKESEKTKLSANLILDGLEHLVHSHPVKNSRHVGFSELEDLLMFL